MRDAASLGRSRGDRESGAVGAGTAIGLALAGIFVYLLLGAFAGDSARFGRAPIPSKSVVELEDGDTDVYYFEGIQSEDTGLLVTPTDLGYTISSPETGPLRIDSRGGETEPVDGGLARVIGAAYVPEDGTYEVSVSSSEAARRITPQLTFGQSPTQAVGSRFESVLEALQGPIGIAAAVVLVFLFLLPRFRRALSR